MLEIPEYARAYSQTKVFTQDTVPDALLKEHNTKENVWAKIIILKGKLKYVIYSDPRETVMLGPDKYGVVEPQKLHHIEPQGEVEFYVEFYQ